MSKKMVFVSVGGTANQQQEEFVSAIEKRLQSENLVPQTVGRNTFTSKAPLKKVADVMDDCSGAVIIALERYYFKEGIEKRGGENEKYLSNVILPTTWNQIEAAMAYSRGLPLLVIVENGLKSEGLLETNYDWYVQNVTSNVASLHTDEFNGVLASWKQEMNKSKKLSKINPNELTISELFGNLRTSQLWGMILAIGTIITVVFALGALLDPNISSLPFIP